MAQSLITIVVSALVAALVSHWFIKRREKEGFEREKLEELYRAVMDYKTTLDIFILNFEGYMKEKPSEKEYYELISNYNASDDERVAMRKIKAIIYLWFSEFVPQFEELDGGAI